MLKNGAEETCSTKKQKLNGGGKKSRKKRDVEVKRLVCLVNYDRGRGKPG